MANKHQHIFAEDMSDEMCQFALETSQEAFQLTISKGQVSERPGLFEGWWLRVDTRLSTTSVLRAVWLLQFCKRRKARSPRRARGKMKKYRGGSGVASLWVPFFDFVA